MNKTNFYTAGILATAIAYTGAGCASTPTREVYTPKMAESIEQLLKEPTAPIVIRPGDTDYDLWAKRVNAKKDQHIEITPNTAIAYTETNTCFGRQAEEIDVNVSSTKINPVDIPSITSSAKEARKAVDAFIKSYNAFSEKAVKEGLTIAEVRGFETYLANAGAMLVKYRDLASVTRVAQVIKSAGEAVTYARTNASKTAKVYAGVLLDNSGGKKANLGLNSPDYLVNDKSAEDLRSVLDKIVDAAVADAFAKGRTQFTPASNDDTAWKIIAFEKAGSLLDQNVVGKDEVGKRLTSDQLKQMKNKSVVTPAIEAVLGTIKIDYKISYVVVEQSAFPDPEKKSEEKK